MKVVILTCDSYAWLVPVFLHFYKKYWPDNPYKTEIITEKGHIDGTVFYTRGRSWSTGLINYLNQSKEEKFILIDEDCLIDKTVNTGRVRLAEKLCEGNVGCVKLNAPEKYYNRHAVESGVKFYKEYPLDKPYSMSMQVAIWQKRYLLDVLQHRENAWRAELFGSARLTKLKGKWRILWAKSAVIEYQAGGIMRKGRLEPRVLNLTKAALKADGTDESMAMYEILQDKIKSHG